MAKKSSGESHKISFGKRKCGRAKKSKGPKDKSVKKYRRQGRV